MRQEPPVVLMYLAKNRPPRPVTCSDCVSFRNYDGGRCGRFLERRVFASFGCLSFAPRREVA